MRIREVILRSEEAIKNMPQFKKEQDLKLQLSKHSARCECGETQTYDIIDKDFNCLDNIAVCENCGDED